MKKIVSLLALLCLPILVNAEKVQIDGIWYNLIEKAKQAEVTSADDGTKYTGEIVIPETVTYEEVVYEVTSIGENAFYECSSLTSVTIGNSVTNIGEKAFYWCSRLTSITIGNSVTNIGNHPFFYCFGLTSVHITDLDAWCKIVFEDYESNPLYYAEHLYLNGEEIKDLVIPNSVTSIGDYAFSLCSGLTSVIIPNSVTSIGEYAFYLCSGLTSVTIPNSVTSIGESAFSYCSSLTSVTIPNSVTSIEVSSFNGCSGLTSITIPNSVTSIGDGAFNGCSGLTSITIPNSVTSIGYWVFQSCSGLTSVTIPNSVTDIGAGAFYECSGLTSVTIPNSVTSIDSWTFQGCSGLTSVTIGNSVMSIGGYAFRECKKLTDVYCYAEKVPSTQSDAFADSYIEYATLHVPESAIEDYKATAPWSGFGTFKTLSGEVVEVEKCATPTISYQNGKLTFACETEGVEFISEITDEDIKKHYEAEVSLAATYTVSVYATKAECEDSETATATLCWIECTEEHEDEEGNGVINIPSTPVLIQSQTGAIIVNGLTDDTLVSVYSIDGKEVGSATTVNGVASISTTLQAGDVAIVKVGAKSVKIIMK